MLHKTCISPTSLLQNGPQQPGLPFAPNSLPSPHRKLQAGITKCVSSSLVLQVFLSTGHGMVRVYFYVLKDVTTVPKPAEWRTSSGVVFSLQGLVPMALKEDLSASPIDSILNSLSGQNLQEALEEWIIHSLALLPMDLCFLLPIQCSVFVLTVIGDFCATFDGSWGQARSIICSTHSNSITHQSTCQTQLSSEILMTASLT